ncbi:Rne/Rng family ribonuclease [Granulibacter bethesdensis]|uniref:Rne/Rng family ribonuclease n=1 Tax=Granulibacter bethesdensis TaxID=364410 RepID=UPI00046CA773|nr:ribonuclease E/G [Granulibacter bethesdensis]
MTKKMLIDASHAEETRVVVMDGNRLEDFDVEAASRKQIKGNIYLAKVVRVEPSLQAAFVEYGGNRHGFLAFSEIHPDYYQIPVADRQRLLAMQEEEAREEEEAEEAEFSAAEARRSASRPLNNAREVIQADSEQPEASDPQEDGADHGVQDESAADFSGEAGDEGSVPASAGEGDDQEESRQASRPARQKEDRERRSPRFLRNYKIQEVIKRRQILLIQVVKEERGNKGAALSTYISLAGRYCVLMPNSPRGGGVSRKITSATDRRRLKDIIGALEIPRGMGIIVRTAGGNRPKAEIMRDCEYLLRLWDDIRDITLRSSAPALIHEEASLIKRAIRDVYTSTIEEVLVDGEEGWRAARDIMRMLMPSHARKVICWNADKERAGQPLFAHYQVESQLDAILAPNVSLKSGGYLVINQAEALVAIDVNSGRSTKERGIEETALRTNLEAADEVARQLRLRDLAGLIVIDFIDMESRKHNGMVERRLKEALKNDRARIQVGQISSFGLLEMSRQRLRPSLTETSMITCPHCNGLGLVRTTEGASVHVLRAIEEEGARRRYAEIMVHAAADVAFYILNNRRDFLATLESRFGMKVLFSADTQFSGSQLRIEKIRARAMEDVVRTPLIGVADPQPSVAGDLYDFADASDGFATFEAAQAGALPVTVQAELVGTTEEGSKGGRLPSAEGDSETGQNEGDRRRRRRRRRRGNRRDDGGENDMNAGSGQDENGNPVEEGEGVRHGAADTPELPVEIEVEIKDLPVAGIAAEEAGVETQGHAIDGTQAAHGEFDDAFAEDSRPRRRGRRGGRGRRQSAQANGHDAGGPVAYTGPTPADPFGQQPLDVFDVIEQPMIRDEKADQNFRSERHPDPVPEPVAASVAERPIPGAAETAAVSEEQAEPYIAPPIQPVVIEDAAPQSRRGWWKR